MRTLLMLPLLFLSFTTPARALLLPPEGIELTQTYVQFEWSAVASVASYDVQVVIDDGSPDPFVAAIPVVDVNVDASEPRTVVRSGLRFGDPYAWRVRGVDGAALAWSSTYRFETAALPANFPTMTVTTFGGAIQPGLTLFNVQEQSNLLESDYIVAVTISGEVVYFQRGDPGVRTVRLLPNGRLLINGGGLTREVTLNAQLAWRTPDGLTTHHEAFAMPNGDVMSLTRSEREIEYQGETRTWLGDTIVVVDRQDNDIVWTWDSFDHFSTLDVDATVYATGGIFDWTHANAANYVASQDSVYLSVRHLNRIVRIDFATGDIIYGMGFVTPSGDADFGDNLFSWQHAPEVQPNGNMLVYDNGNRRDHMVQTAATGVTKAIELSFTGEPPTDASIVWEWTVPTYNGAVGDADRLANGNTLVVAGRNQMIHEVDASGSEVWRLEVTPPGSGDVRFYRADRVGALVLDVSGDQDGDSLADMVDNCPDHSNVDQADSNGDGFGDVCALALGLPVEPAIGGEANVPMMPTIALVLLGTGLFAAAVPLLRHSRLRRSN